MTRLLVVISDTHVGSTVGLLRPGYTTAEGNEIRCNAGQLWLWAAFEELRLAVKKIKGKSEAALIVNGDIIEGVHHGGRQVISNDPADHIGAARWTLQPLAEVFEKVYITKGTECHTGNHEHAIGDMLGAEKHPATGQRAADEWHLDVAGVPISVRHHIMATLRAWTMASGLGIALTHEQVTAYRCGYVRPRVIVRAHRHQDGVAELGDSMIAVTGPWQHGTRYAHKVATASVAQPSALILDWRQREDGQLPAYTMVRYTPPAPERVTL